MPPTVAYAIVTTTGSSTVACLAQSVRSATIRRAMAAAASPRGPCTAAKEDAGDPGTPPCANLAVRSHATGLEVVMGARARSRDPDARRSFAIPMGSHPERLRAGS